MLHIPYGKGFIEYDEGDAAVLSSSIGTLKAEKSGREIVREAMDAPIDSPTLKELARGKKSCTLIVSDHTRPVPSKDILPEMIKELLEGSPDIKITLLVATGFHRLTNTAELEAKLGREIMEQCAVVVHDCRDEKSNVNIGVLPSGAPLVVDRLAVETELLVAEGFIEPHFFAGFSGGRKSVLPGVCDRVTVLGNHCGRFIDSDFARTGISEGNPIQTDMLAAAEMAKLRYIVNVIIDEDKNTVAAFAGNYKTAHEAGCEYLKSFCAVKRVSADIVVTSNGGAPLDQNVYQCVKSMTAAEACCKAGGTIVVCAECADGHGGEGFYRSLKDCESPAQLYAQEAATPMEKTIADQWESQILARILMKHKVIFVTRAEMRPIIEDMKMSCASTLDEAMKMAKTGGETVAFIPNGISVIVC